MNYKLKPIFAGLIAAALINAQGDETNNVSTNSVPVGLIKDTYIPNAYEFTLLGLLVNTNGTINWTNGVDNVTLQWQTNSYSDTPNQLFIMERVVKNRMLMLIKGGETNYLKGEQLGEILTNWIPVKVEYKK